MQLEVRLALPRDGASVPLVRHIVKAALQGARVTPDCVSEVEVAISEACTNVVLHAHQSNRYEVQITIGDEQLGLDVIDSGTGFGAADMDASMPEHTAHNGRGLGLMTSLMDKAVFDSVTGEGGSVHMMKRLRWVDTVPVATVPFQAWDW